MMRDPFPRKVRVGAALVVFLRPECEWITQTERQVESICIARDWGVTETGHRLFLHPTKTIQDVQWIAICGTIWWKFWVIKRGPAY